MQQLSEITSTNWMSICHRLHAYTLSGLCIQVCRRFMLYGVVWTFIEAKRYSKMYEWMRDNPLPNNVSPDAFSERINEMIRDVNPYLDSPLEGVRLGRPLRARLEVSQACRASSH